MGEGTLRQSLCWQEAGGQAGARFSPAPAQSLDFDAVSSLQPRCLEPCPGQLQPPWGLRCSDLPAQLRGGRGGLSPGLGHGEGAMGGLPTSYVNHVSGAARSPLSSQSPPQSRKIP